MKSLFSSGRLLCAAALACLLPQIGLAQYVGQSQDHLKVATKAPVKVESFDLREVKLLDGRFKENMERSSKWLLSIRNDQLLHTWRLQAGLPSTAKPLGGWEAPGIELRGHTMGHVLSGLALLYASTGKAVYKQKGDSLVAALATCQKAMNQKGYLSAFPESLIDRCIAGQKVWAPWYTIHKVLAGLTDMYLYADNQQALRTAENLSGWAYQKVLPLTPAQRATMERTNESGGMTEVAYNLYAITGNPNDKKLAELFRDTRVLTPLAQQQDSLNKLHANTQIPKLIGEARGYELTGNEEQKATATFFYKTVLDHHTFATGGNSDYEHFFAPDSLSKHLSPRTTETCNSYNMLKLTRHLFTWTADAKYADYYEQALYNHILAAQDPETGMASYFMPFKPGLFKVYSTPTKAFWCCVGTGFESNGKFAEAIYYHDDKGVFVNLFIPSALNWKEKGFVLTQHTNYPEESTTRLAVERAPAGRVPISIRYPAWATAGATVKVNGKTQSITQQPGSYIKVERQWKAGDKIEVTYPMALHLVPTNDNAAKAAIAYGPIVLAGKMGTEGLSAPAPYAPKDQNDFNKYAIPADFVSTLTTHGNNVNKWVKPVANKPLVFKTTGVTSTDITLIPYYQIHGERYVLYWDLQ